MSFLSLILILIFVMDPIGNTPSFLSLVERVDPERRRWILFREMTIALLVMLFFLFLGPSLVRLFDLSKETVFIASGLILFLIAIKILFSAPDSPRAHLPTEEPFIFPLAVPLIAGPALIATIMLYGSIEPTFSLMLPSILVAWFISVTILYFGHTMRWLFGTSGLIACERLIGMVLVLISIQRVFDGLFLLSKT